MDKFEIQLNDILINTFYSILKVEELSIKKFSKVDLTINETHMIEAIGDRPLGKATISEIASGLGITLPSVTVAINKLRKKGYVEKIKSEQDGRFVYITLTRQGKKIYNAHRYFHYKIIKNISKGFTDIEKKTLFDSFNKLNIFFDNKIKDLED
jgi:DNA-binding MarR family transcriptional regulator